MIHQKLISFIYQALKPFRLALTVMFIIIVIWAIDVSLRPYLMKVIIDRISQPSISNVFEVVKIPVVIYFLATLAFSSIHRFYNYFIEIKMIPNMRRNIANVAFGSLLKQSYSYYQNNFAGSLTNKVNDLTASIPDIVQLVLDRLPARALALTIAIFILWKVNIVFAIGMLSWAFIFMSISIIFTKKLSHLADSWSELGSVITGRMVDRLSNILSIRLFARSKEERSSLSETFDEAVKAEQKLQWAYFWIWFFYGYAFVVLQGINLYFLINGRQEGWISVGDFVVVLGINTAIADFLWEFAQDLSQFSKLWGRATQALRTIEVIPEIQDKPDANILKITQGQIVFDAVKFNYKNATPIFSDKSITIKSGQKVGLVGYSGGGKSTFVNLILRLYDVNNGRILIDEQDIRDVTQDSLHANIATIPQDPSLFHRSLMENIRYGQIEATDEEVIEAAKHAHAHEFITKLPQGYESLVGERGVKLSGGQRQRIAIARAILKNAPILILDEATSQLDSVTESHIQESLWELMQNKTTLVIAHRLSTLLHMDRILVFNEGKIVEDGTHQELLNKGGLYKTLWDSQVGGFLNDNKR